MLLTIMSAVGALGHWAGLGYGQCACSCVTQLNVVLCVGCELFFSVVACVGFACSGHMCSPAALAAWLGGRAAVEKRLPNQGMCCLGSTPKTTLWWTGLAAVCLLPVVLAAAMPVWQSILQGKSCVVCVWQFGALFSRVGWKSAFDACLWSYHGNTRGRAGLCQGAATRSMVTVEKFIQKVSA